MRKINYKLIVSDFDGTLIDSHQKIPPKVVTAINNYIENGGIFAVCTGRMLRSILPQVRALGLKGLVIAYQGSIIADIESGNIIYRNGMEYSDIVEICKNLEELNQPVNVYSDNDLYTNLPKENEYLQLYERIVCVEAESVEGKISEFVEKEKLYCQKVAVLVAKDERDALYGELKKRFGTRFDVTCSAKELVEISPITDNKGNALKFLASHYKIPVEKTVAVGDNLNDAPMIIAAGMGVAVRNADPGLKEVADYICPITNNEGALAQIIEKFGFA